MLAINGVGSCRGGLQLWASKSSCLSTYSPNLNLIERVWKFVRKECLYAKYYEHFDLFKQAIQHCLAETTGRHALALSSLLTLEFQSFQSATSDL